MPNYYCYPLCYQVSDEAGEIDSSELSLSNELAGFFQKWAKEYDATPNQNDPSQSGFTNLEERTKFVVLGYELAVKLKREVGNQVDVVYYDIDQLIERNI